MSNSASPIIERATSDDLEGIVRVYEDDSAGGHGDRWSVETEPRYRATFARMAANPEYALFVARVDAQIVGTFLLHFNDTLVGIGGRACRLHSVAVLAAWRGRGVGAAMLRRAEAEAKAGGAVSLMLTSSRQREDAHRFYLREGYIERYRAFSKRL